MAAKGISNTMAWILLALLILGLGGFGVTNLSGNVRSVGSVGDQRIDVDDYARALQREIRAIEAERGSALSFAEAQQMGVPESVLTRLVASAAFDYETARIGLSVGDEALLDEIVSMPQFQGLDGKFDREAYRYGLDQAGLSETQFEEDIRTETARGFLQAAVVAGVQMPDGYMNALTDYLGQRRDVTWAVLDRTDLATGLPVPEEADLAAYHQDHAERYTLPERKRITYAWLSPDMLLDSVEVDETALREAYEGRAEEYNRPERRLVERLAFADTAAAEAAIARVTSGEADFETLVAERGLDLSDTDLGDVTREELGDAAEAVFAAEVGDVVGPLPSSVGPALFRVDARLAAQTTTFEEALPDLRAELAAGRARRMVEGRIDAIDDLLAGGATIEDLAEETEMELGSIDWHPGITDGIAAFEAFRAAATELAEGDYPEVITLDDGGIFAMRLDEVIAPQLQPLDAVREEVTAAWSAEKLVEELEKQVAPAVAKLESGARFEDAGLTEDDSQTLTRRSFVAGAPSSMIDEVFTLDPGKVALIGDAGRLFVLRLDAVHDPDPEDPDLQQLQGLLRQQAASGLAQDLFQVLANDIRTRAGIELDQSALNAVHANFR